MVRVGDGVARAERNMGAEYQYYSLGSWQTLSSIHRNPIDLKIPTVPGTVHCTGPAYGYKYFQLAYAIIIRIIRTVLLDEYGYASP